LPAAVLIYSLAALGRVSMLIAGLGMGELVVILIIVIVIFGAAKLPQLGKGLGEGISNFREGLNKGGKNNKLDEKKTNSLDA
jgi:sec-independent protein translocase protein TatA